MKIYKNKLVNIILIFFFLIMFNSNNYSQIKEPSFQGKFYPENKEELSKFIEKALSEVKIEKINPEDVISLISPHAGYIFSGKVAAYSYKSILNQKYDTVIILGTGHTMLINGGAIYSGNAFKTPLGIVEIDKELTEKIIKENSLFEFNDKAFLKEHSIEVQIPFLQKVLKPNFKILPILMNNASFDSMKKMGETLAKNLKNKKSIIIISSDLSHYPNDKTAKIVDETTILSLKTMSCEYFALTNEILMHKGEENLSVTWCGETAVITGLFLSKLLGSNEVLKLKYSNSFRENKEYGDPLSVVGYASILFVKNKKAEDFKIVLNEKEKEYLLNLARETIVKKLNQEEINTNLSDDYALNLPGAVFVTLKEKGNLRGCIGSLTPQMTIKDAVSYFALQSAFNDTRFLPLTKEEINKIKIEISILSPLTKINSIDEIIPKKDGVIIKKGNKSGVFLPQVWDEIKGKEDFLNELCIQKAGLNKKCWEDKNTELYTFSVDSFNEK